MRTLLLAASLLTLAWGALAFGGVYPWAYTPLAIASGAIGAGTLLVCYPWHAPLGRIAGGLVVIGAIAGLQLIPLPPRLLAAVSPGTDRYLRAYDFSYTLAQYGTDLDLEAPLPPPSRPVSLAPDRTRVGLGLFCAFATFLLGLTALLSVAGARPLINGLVLIGAGLALFGIIQYILTGGETYLVKVYGFWIPEYRGAPFGPFINRNHFAGWMLMVIPLAATSALAAAATYPGGGFRAFAAWLSSSSHAAEMQLMAGAMVVMVLSVLMTGSRSGLASLGLAGLVALFLVLRRQQSAGHRATTIGIVFIVGVLLVGWAGFETLVARLGAAGADGSAGGRLRAWADTLRIASSYPLAGVGLNAYGAAMLQFQSSNPSALHFNEAHNDYLQILAEGGLLMSLAVAATLAAFVSAVRARFREAPHQGTTYWARVGAVVGLGSIATQSAFEFSLQMPGNAVLLCALAAIALHRSPRLRTRGRSKESHHGDAPHP